MKPISQVDEIVNDSFGLWISSLFSAIGARNPDFTFEDQKTAFFWLIENLLRDGKIKFIAPGADCYASPENPHPHLTIEDEAAHWHKSPEFIVNQLLTHWPKDAHDENDIEISLYFYSIPGVIWIGKNGELVAS